MIAPAIVQSGAASGTHTFAQVSARARMGRAVERAPAEARAGSTTDAIELLAACYPVICRLVGDDSFRVMACRYMLSEFGRSSSRVEYGDTFPQFLRGRGSAASTEYVADIATLEMLLDRARRAPPAVPVSPTTLSALRIDRCEDFGFVLHPSVFTVASRFPIVTLWENNRRDAGNTMIARWCAEAALVARPLLDVEVWRLPVGGHAFLGAVSEGRTLAAAFAAGKAAAPRFDAAANLSLVIEANLVVGFREHAGMITSVGAGGDSA